MEGKARSGKTKSASNYFKDWSNAIATIDLKNSKGIVALPSVGSGIDGNANIYPAFKEGGYDIENGNILNSAYEEEVIKEWWDQLSDDDYIIVSKIATKKHLLVPIRKQSDLSLGKKEK
jgi:hypothetical protein